MKYENNANYLGKGQEKVCGKDGYYTIFTAAEGKIYKEYKQNGNASWSKNKYWDNCIETDGCAIVALAIILSGYGKKYTPEDLRVKYYPAMKLEFLDKILSEDFDIKATLVLNYDRRLSKETIFEHLLLNKPVMICVWKEFGENIWTAASHYMVLLAYDGKDSVYVSNPNGIYDKNGSGWYDIGEVFPYIAKAIFIDR